MSRHHSRFFACALGGAFGILAFLASTATAREEEPFRESIEVRVVNLEAVVEDAAGQRVAGLAPGDFELLVDGKAQPIDYFAEIRDGLLPQAAGGASPPGLADLDPAAAAPGEPAAAARLPTAYLVFIDLVLSDPRQTAYAASQLADDLAALPAEDRVAIFAFDGVELHRLAGWRSSREERSAALNDLYRLPAGAGAALAETAASDALARHVTDDETAASVVQVAQRLGRRMDAVLTAAATAMEAADPPPGRRVMLTFGGNWPRDFAVYLGVATSAEYSQAVRNRFPRASFEQLYQKANQLGYTLYTSDLFRHRNHIAHAANADVGTARDQFDLDTERNNERDSTFGKFAEETGGRAFVNGWGEETLAAIRHDLASFYWMGFTAPRRYDGKSHAIALKVKKSGLAVRSRRQFSDPSRPAELDQELTSRLLVDREGERQDFTVLPGEPQERRGELTLPVTLRIPLEQVVFLPRGKEYRAELELRVAAVDESGGRSPIPTIPVKLDGPKPQPGQYATYETSLRLRRASQRFVLGLYDKQGSRLLLSTVRLPSR